MIGYLCGQLLEKTPPTILVSIQGVGYDVDVSMQTFYRLPDIGQELRLHIHAIFREDAQMLYGFWEKRERQLFREFLKVTGIGAKTALGILSTLDVDACVSFVLNGEADRLMSVPGIGRKTAERLIVEMKDRVLHLQTSKAWVVSPDGTGMSPRSEAIHALISLGYKPNDATQAIAQAEREGCVGSEALIRTGLKTLAVQR